MKQVQQDFGKFRLKVINGKAFLKCLRYVENYDKFLVKILRKFEEVNEKKLLHENFGEILQKNFKKSRKHFRQVLGNYCAKFG